MKRKLTKGTKVLFQSKTWVVCDGGQSDPQLKSYRYKLARGSWKRLIPGNQIRAIPQTA